MAVSPQPTYFALDSSAPASTYDAVRELLWWMNGTHPTTANTISFEFIEVYDGTTREVPAGGLLSTMATSLWRPRVTPLASLPTGAWAVFRTVGGVVSAQCQFFVKLEAAGEVSISLISLDDWTIGAGTDASPTLPATIIGQPPTGDGAVVFPSTSVLFYSMVMDEGMFLIKQFPASGLVNLRWAYLGEVDPATDESDDPRPFITSKTTAEGWDGGYTHVRLSPVDQSTLCELRNRPFYFETFDSTNAYDDLGVGYLSNVAIDSAEPVGHRFVQGYFRNAGAIDQTALSNRATAGYTSTDFRFEVFGTSTADPQVVTAYPPGTALSAQNLVTEESVPTQLIPAVAAAPFFAERLLNTIRHLLPKSRQWNLVYARDFLKLMLGITPSLDAAANNADTVFTDLIPATATASALTVWERQFALGASSSLTLAERRTRLAGVWSSIGGQSPSYITLTLQSHGFPVFTHEWWDLAGNGYPVAKDPRDHLLPLYGGTDTDGILLVNDIRTSVKFDEMGAGEVFAEAGEERALSGYYGGFLIGQVGYSYVGPETRHPYYLYIGGSTFPNTVNIPIARKSEFEQLCQKICPAQQWLVLRVRYI